MATSEQLRNEVESGPISGEVCEGVRFLDTEYPGWLGAIDLDTLDLDDATACVAGQVAAEYLTGGGGRVQGLLNVAGDYWAMVREWNPGGGILDRDVWASSRGFLAQGDGLVKLQADWERVIVDLRADDGGDLCDPDGDVSPPTILDIAIARGAVTDPETGGISGAEFERVGLPIMGGCEVCGASIAAYNAYPGRDGFLVGGECLEGAVTFGTVAEFELWAASDEAAMTEGGAI